MRIGMIKRIAVVWISIILLPMLCGCSSLGEDKNLENEYLQLTDSPSTTLDNVWYNPGGIFRCAVFESLLLVDADMKKIKGALAKEYEVSDDGKIYTFTLRDDVTWHDGEKFDVEDVLFSIKAALCSDEVNGLFTAAFQHIKGATDFWEGKSEEISGITVQGNVLTITLISSTADFLSAIAQFAILPEHILSEVEPNQLSQHDFWKNPIGCGCYKVVKAEENCFYLESYEDYYGKHPGIKQIRMTVKVENPVEALREGILDFYVSNDPEEIAQLKGLENCSEHQLSIMFPTYLILNVSEDEGVNEALKDVRVREALLLAIDRETLTDALFPGSSVINTLIPAWDEYYLPDAKEYSYDPETAKLLLEEAGFDFSKELRLRYSVKGTSTADLMEAIAVYWRSIGIKVNVEKFEGSGSQHMFYIRDYDVCYKRLSAFDYATIYGEVQGDGIMQTKLYNQPIYDELIGRLETTLDESERRKIVHEMQRLDQQGLFRIPLFALATNAYVNSEHLDVPEIYGNLWYRYDLCFDQWKLVKK